MGVIVRQAGKGVAQVAVGLQGFFQLLEEVFGYGVLLHIELAGKSLSAQVLVAVQLGLQHHGGEQGEHQHGRSEQREPFEPGADDADGQHECHCQSAHHQHGQQFAPAPCQSRTQQPSGRQRHQHTGPSTPYRMHLPHQPPEHQIVAYQHDEHRGQTDDAVPRQGKRHVEVERKGRIHHQRTQQCMHRPNGQMRSRQQQPVAIGLYLAIGQRHPLQPQRDDHGTKHMEHHIAQRGQRGR